MSNLQFPRVGIRLDSSLVATRCDVSGLAGAQALILYRLVRCVHVADHVRHIHRYGVHDHLFPSVN
jgi:hypothetical protein